MKVILQRHGIVIKSVPIQGDRASIGSSPEATVMIDDPYLAAQVADIVRQPDGWHLVDSGISLEGITRDGQRIDDELVVPGAAYSLGGFELVVQLEGDEAASQAKQIARRTGEQPSPGRAAAVLPTMAENVAIPHTMMDTELPAGEIPKTMFEAPMPASVGRQAPPPPRPQQQHYQPQQMIVPPPPAAVAATPAKKSPRRVVLLATALGLGFLLLLIVLVGGGDEKKPVQPEVATTTAAPVVVTPTLPAPPPGASAAQSLAALRYDDALHSWERQLDGPSGDADTRKRYAELALEVGRIHAANGSSEAQKYFTRAVKYGPPDSPAVAEAKRRLAR